MSAGATDAGVDALRRAVLGARGSGDRELLVRSLVLATAQREIHWVNLLRGRYERGRVWLDRARDTAPDDLATCAWVDATATGGSPERCPTRV